jgi:DNA modification methylase
MRKASNDNAQQSGEKTIAIESPLNVNAAKYRIDPEFAGLLPSTETDNQLKDQLIEDGRWQDAITVWEEEKILIDGHRRNRIYEEVLAEGNKLEPMQVTFRSFKNRRDAAWWAINYQASRRNLTPAQYALTILDNEKLLSEVSSAASSRKRSGKKVKDGEKGRTNQLLAEKSGNKASEWGIFVVRKAREAAEERPKIKPAIEELERKLRTNDISLGAFDDLTKKLVRYEETNDRANAAKEIKLPPVPKGKIIDTILNMDVLDGVAKLDDESVDLTFTSPPYPLKDVRYPKYEYDGDYAKFLQWQDQVFASVYQKTKPGGWCAINTVECSDQTGGKRTNLSQRPLLFVPGDYVTFMVKQGWILRDTVIWYKQKFNGTRPAAGSHSAVNPRYQRSWEHVFFFRKPGKIAGDIALEDMNRAEFSQWQDGHWSITPETKKTTGHRCPFPAELARRPIQRHTRRGDLILDPFCGTGTTCWVANGIGRRFIGIDNDPESVAEALERLKTPYVEPVTKDKLEGLTPQQRVNKLVNFRNRQKGQDAISRHKKSSGK